MRAMPWVAAASDDVADSLAQGMVYFSVYVDAANDLTGDQLAAVTRPLSAGASNREVRGYRTELDVRRGWNVFAVDSGRMPITNRDQILQPGAGLGGPATRIPRRYNQIAGHYRPSRWPNADPGVRTSNTATLTLNGGADYTAVAATVRSLSTGFSRSNSIDWTISAVKDHPAQIATSRRLPTAARSACGPAQRRPVHPAYRPAQGQWA